MREKIPSHDEYQNGWNTKANENENLDGEGRLKHPNCRYTFPVFCIKDNKWCANQNCFLNSY